MSRMQGGGRGGGMGGGMGGGRGGGMGGGMGGGRERGRGGGEGETIKYACICGLFCHHIQRTRFVIPTTSLVISIIPSVT